MAEHRTSSSDVDEKENEETPSQNKTEAKRINKDFSPHYTTYSIPQRGSAPIELLEYFNKHFYRQCFHCPGPLNRHTYPTDTEMSSIPHYRKSVLFWHHDVHGTPKTSYSAYVQLNHGTTKSTSTKFSPQRRFFSFPIDAP